MNNYVNISKSTEAPQGLSDLEWPAPRAADVPTTVKHHNSLEADVFIDEAIAGFWASVHLFKCSKSEDWNPSASLAHVSSSCIWTCCCCHDEMSIADKVGMNNLNSWTSKTSAGQPIWEPCQAELKSVAYFKMSCIFMLHVYPVSQQMCHISAAQFSRGTCSREKTFLIKHTQASLMRYVKKNL